MKKVGKAKAERRETKKKKRRYPISGRSVFAIAKIKNR